MNSKALMALGLVIILPLVSYIIVKSYSDDAITMPRRFYTDTIITKITDGKETTDTIWHKVSNITLTNQLGNRVSLDDLKGKVLVADFFFTRCPSICPTLTRNMKKLQDALKRKDDFNRIDSSFVQFLSFSVDPDRDSVTALKKYADRFGVDPDIWWMLTGPKKDIYDFAVNELKLGVEDGKNVDSNYIHTSRFVLLDKQRVVRGYYDGLDSAAINKMASDLIYIMLEKEKKKKESCSDKNIVMRPISDESLIVKAKNKVSENRLLSAAIQKNDPKAKTVIGIFSFVVFATIVAMGKVKLDIDLGFDPHLFARINAVINSMVSVLLIVGIISVKQGKYLLHKRVMFSALVLSILFLISYICHHLFTGDTKFMGQGTIRYIYFTILISHIFLAAVVLPFILFTAYRALISEWAKHKRLARITWPVWLYVSLTGVIVYLMISQYY